MLFSPALNGILLSILFGVKSAEGFTPDCDNPCEESDKKAVCTFEKADVCFRTLPSKCYMDHINCLFQLDYVVYIDEYCELEAFKCKDPLTFQSPPIENQQKHDLENSQYEFEDNFASDFSNENEID